MGSKRPRTPIGRGSLVLGIAVSAAAAGLYLAWMLGRFGGERATVAASDLGLVLGAGAAAVLCLASARRHEGRGRLAWYLTAAAMIAWTAGEGIWSFFEVFASREVPFPSVADAGYLAAIPLAAAAMLTFPSGPTGTRSRARALLDGLTIVASVLLISWVTVLGPLVHAGGESFFEQAIGVAYPAGDVVILTAVFSVVARAASGTRGPLLVLGLGMAAIALADSGYTYLTLNNEYASGGPLDAAWLVGYLLIGLAALASGTGKGPPARAERFTRLGAALPYGAVFAALAVVGTQKTTEGSLDLVTFWDALALVVLVVVRQFLTRLDNVALSQTLETRVKRRTAELDRALVDLREAKLREETFVASTSHELRTPVTTIIGASKTVLHRATGLDEEGRELLEMVHRAGLRMAGLVEDLLAVAGLVNRLDGTATVLDLADVVTAVANDQQALRERLRISLPQPLMAVGDPAGARAVMTHLLENAAKFTAPGTPVHVEGSAGRGFAELVVRDEGPGIPPDLLERIFERFYQVDGTSTREQGGVGLGLFLARRLAEGMRGKLIAEPATRGGTVFRLVLPAPGARPGGHDLGTAPSALSSRE